MVQLKPMKTVYTESDFLGWRRNETLELKPICQRREVWSFKAKSLLTDTIVKGLPMPILFLRKTQDLRKLSSRLEVVDGQQLTIPLHNGLVGSWPGRKLRQWSVKSADDAPVANPKGSAAGAKRSQRYLGHLLIAVIALLLFYVRKLVSRVPYKLLFWTSRLVLEAVTRANQHPEPRPCSAGRSAPAGSREATFGPTRRAEAKGKSGSR